MKMTPTLQELFRKAHIANKTGIPPQITKIDPDKARKDAEKIRKLKEYFSR